MHNQSPLVFIVILQFNNSQDTIRCLNSVKELGYNNFRVLIVDNGSEVNPALEKDRPLANAHSSVIFKGGVDHVNEIRSWIKNGNSDPDTKYLILNTNYNSGYSGGNNIGIKHALQNGADYVFVLNPDTTIEQNALTKLVETAEANPQIGILSPAIDEGNKVVYGGNVEWLKSELVHSTNRPLNTKYKILSTKYYLSGAAMLIKRKVIEKIGLLDERYFLYFEDADYCERARRASYKLAVVPETLVHHKPSSSTSLLGAQLLLRYHFRNAHLFNLKNGPLWAKLALPFWSFWIIIKQLAKIIFMPRKRAISLAILAGVEDFYRGHFGKI